MDCPKSKAGEDDTTMCVCACTYVIVIVRLVCDMAQTQHEAQGECCV